MEKVAQEDWVLKPAYRFIQYFAETSYILNLSINGISEQSRQAQVIQNPVLNQLFLSAVDQYKETVELPEREEMQKTLNLHKRLSIFAADEKHKGFPIIRSHTLVAFWGALEVFVDDLILACLINKTTLLRSESLAKVKIPLAEYEALTKDERLILLLDEMKRQAKSDLAGGINQFEKVLKVIGLDGNVEKELRDNLYFTQQLRNLIVHRGSIADRRFTDACPRFDVLIGDRIELNETEYNRCRDCIEDYVLCLTSRTISYAGYEAIDNKAVAELLTKHLLETMNPSTLVNLI